ncbi:hypothetical protein JCM6882_004828 [Rhodosporidiobolus microsporus]
MPSPTLPLDVIELVFDHLAAVLEEPEGREVGTRLALVCRDWKPFALRLAWRKISLILLEDNRLINHLIEFPQALEYTHCLHLLGTASMLHHADRNKLREDLRNIPEDAVFPFVMNENHSAALSSLLYLCPRLRHLILPSSEYHDLLHPARLSPSVKTLKHLEMNVFRTESFEADAFANTFAKSLTAFPALHLIKLDARYVGDALPPVSIGQVSQRVPIGTLDLSVFATVDSGFPLVLNEVLVASMDPNKLLTTRLQNFNGEATLLKWLAQCTSLRMLEIFGIDPPAVIPTFAILCDVLPHLSSLQGLVFSEGECANPPDLTAFQLSPVELDHFLAILPESAISIKVGGVHFAMGGAYECFSMDELPEENCPMVLAVGVDAEEEDSEEDDEDDEDVVVDDTPSASADDSDDETDSTRSSSAASSEEEPDEDDVDSGVQGSEEGME